MMRFLLLFTFIPFFLSNNNLNTYRLQGVAQGTTYSIMYFAKDSVLTKKEADMIFQELDSSLSIYKPYSKISTFNNTSRGILMDRHMSIVVKKSLDVYKRTDGVFDITIYPIVNAWGFANNKVENLPDSTKIKELMQCVGSSKLVLKGDSLIKTKSCVKIDVNGIAQGYSVDYIAGVLEKKGIKNYLVEVGGELRIKGKKPNGDHMKVGIETPFVSLDQESGINKIVVLKDGAVTTSGNYKKFLESGGKRITHLMNAKTGYPLLGDMISVTVIAQDAHTADAYDNVLMVMSPKEALAFINKQKYMEAYFIFKDKSGAIQDTMSNGFARFLQR